MSAATTHHRAQLLAPEETTAAVRVRDSTMRDDQKIVPDAVSGRSSRCRAFDSPDR